MGGAIQEAERAEAAGTAHLLYLPAPKFNDTLILAPSGLHRASEVRLFGFGCVVGESVPELTVTRAHDHRNRFRMWR